MTESAFTIDWAATLIYLFLFNFFGFIAFCTVGIIFTIGYGFLQLCAPVRDRLSEFYSYAKLYRAMEALATEAQASLKSTAPIEDKLTQLTNLKQEIKHRSCPERAIPVIFNVVRISLATPHAVDAGFSILGHLTKRLLLQDLQHHIHHQTTRLFPVLLDRLGDARERFRQRAVAALSDFYPISDEAHKDVELFIRDSVLVNKNPRAKQSAMQWILETHQEKGMLFRAFVPHLVSCLEDSDGIVRQTAQTTIIDLFQKSSMKSKTDLQKKMHEQGVRKSIESHILADLAIEGTARPAQAADAPPTPATVSKKITRPQVSHQAPIETPPDVPPSEQPMSIAEQEAASLTPIYIESIRDLEDTFREMQTWFEGKEGEHNWLKREKSIDKLRRIVKGNAPQDYTVSFLANIKIMLDGILKAVNSLRTTVCTIGCHLVQDLARVCGPGIDQFVEVLLQNLIKLCGNTKKIASAKAKDTVSAIMQHGSYHVRLLQHIQLASCDKNAQTRTYSSGWLQTVLQRHSKAAIDHSGGLELAEKSLKNGLNDSNPSVRESMRGVYWTYAKMWPDRSEVIMSSLTLPHQDMLVKHAANPNPQITIASSAAPGKSTFSKSTGAVPNRPSIKEAIAAQKRAKAAGRDLPDRPGSAAETSTSPTKPTAPARPATSMSTSRSVSTTSTGNLSSAPVRPRRRADMTKSTSIDQPHGVQSHSTIPRPSTPPQRSTMKQSPNRKVKDDLYRPLSPSVRDTNQKSPQRRALPSKQSAASPESKKISPTRPTAHTDEDLTQIMPTLAANYTQNQMTVTGPDQYSLGSFDLTTPEKPSLNTADLPDRGGSPLKNQLRGSFDAESNAATHSPNRNVQRMSMSPKITIAGRKENLQNRMINVQDTRGLRVYEDPEDEERGATQATMHLSPRPGALGELPVNEPLNRTKASNEDGFKLVGEEHSTARAAEYHADWRILIQRQRSRINRDGETFDNPLQAQKILQSGITRVSAKSLDVHGFRKLQSIIAFAPKSVWEDGYKIQELIMPLLDYLEESKFDDIIDAVKDLDVKTQILVTIKLLFMTYQEWLEPFYVQIVCSCVAARKNYHPSTHMVAGLEETVEEILRHCQPLDVIANILDLVEADNAHLTKNMSCYVLGGQLHKCHREALQPPVDRIGQLATKCLQSSNPDVRRAAVEMSLELYYNVSEEQFWSLISEVRDDYKGLVSYYLARHQFVHQA